MNRVAQSVVTDYGLDGPAIESRWGEIFRTGSFPVVKYGWDVLLTTHLLLVPWSWKSRAIPLLTLWTTIGPVTGTVDCNYFKCKFYSCERDIVDKKKLYCVVCFMIRKWPIQRPKHVVVKTSYV